MAKIQMVIADEDEVFLEHLARYLMENAERCEISTFSSGKSLAGRLTQGGHIDILLTDREMMCEEADQADISVKILLSSDGSGVDGYETIKKYQKAENILKEALLKYAEATGNIESLRGGRRTKTAAFYSPSGGSGKTTLAIASAAACSAAGLHTFYLNMEKIDSSSLLFGKTPGTMSEVFLALKAKGGDAGMKILAARGEEPRTGIHYISSADSILEYTELTQEEMTGLISSVVNLNEYDVLIVDLASEFNQEKVNILSNCDRIFVPVVQDEFSVNRIKALLYEDTMHGEYSSILKKMRLLVNKADSSGLAPILQNSGILNQIPLTAVISMSPTLMNQSNLLRAAEVAGAVFRPIVSEIQGG